MNAKPAPGRSSVRRRERSEEDFEAWLAYVTERLDPFMAWLGVVFALLVGYDIAVELGSSAARALSIAGWVIWAIFALELGAKLWLAPKRLRFLKRHWLQAIGLVIPTLRVFRFLRWCGSGGPCRRRGSSARRTGAWPRRASCSVRGSVTSPP